MSKSHHAVRILAIENVKADADNFDEVKTTELKKIRRRMKKLDLLNDLNL
jgi:hypothetical protein